MNPACRALALLVAALLSTGMPRTASAGAGQSAPATPDFGGEMASASAPVREVLEWVLRTGDNGHRSVVVVDKKLARVYVLDPRGRLLGVSAALLGSARGDHSVPGIGQRPLSQIRPEERTTPAGRFIPEPGVNAQGEDIVWVDYDAAVSMHRVRARVQAERRLQRLASPTPADNRVSYGCINLPPRFYDTVLVPAVRSGAVVYVLPETRSPGQVFGLRQRTTPAGSAGAGPADTVRQEVLMATDAAVMPAA